MDRYQEEQEHVGRVEISKAYEVQWQVTEGRAWAARTGGEYHTVELPDGHLALLYWVASESDAHGYHCRSLYLGAFRPNEPGLDAIDLPAKPNTPVFTATKTAIRAAFWRNPEDALQIACLTGTGDRVREWLYLRLSQMNRHLGIFSQSGSGKSYAVGRLIEELLIKVKAVQDEKCEKTRRVRVIILDQNGDFRAFSESKKHSEILLSLERMFHNIPVFTPDYSWENWLEKRTKMLKSVHIYNKLDNIMSDEYEGKVIYHIADLQDDRDGSKVMEVLESISNPIFDGNRDEDRHDLTFIVIDEAHNIVPRELISDDNNKNRKKTQRIINKSAAEGSKYGAFLIIISQSPSKVHPDTLSQCSNLMVMRLTRREDIKTIADLRIDVPAELIGRIARFGQGDALFIGDYVPAPATARVVGRISKEGGSGPKVEEF